MLFNQKSEDAYDKEVEQAVKALNKLNEIFQDADIIEEEKESWDAGNYEDSGLIKKSSDDPAYPMAILYFNIGKKTADLRQTSNSLKNNLYFQILENIGAILSPTTKSFRAPYIGYLVEIKSKLIIEKIPKICDEITKLCEKKKDLINDSALIDRIFETNEIKEIINEIKKEIRRTTI